MITYTCLLNIVFSFTGISDNNFYISDNNFYSYSIHQQLSQAAIYWGF